MVSAPRNLLSGPHNLDRVHSALATGSTWRRHPAASDRDAWEKLPADVRQRLLAEGEKRLTET